MLGEDVNIVSLGANCLPKVVLSRWGIIGCRSNGTPTYPLDLCWSSDDGALRAAVSGFAHLCDPAELRVDPETGWVRNDAAEVIFNHEVGAEWQDDGFAKLRNRYERRADAFARTLANGKQSVLVYCSHSRFTSHTRDLLADAADHLISLCPSDIAVLAVVTGQTEADLTSFGRVQIMHNPLPTPGYLFHQPEFYLSPEGVEFEQRIVSAVRALAAKLKLPVHSR